MTDCQCDRLERTFNDKVARDDLRDYLRNGPDRSTALLIDAVRPQAAGRTLLDIGGGIGAIQLELLAAGATEATDVDASAAYVETAREEATRRGLGERITYRRGDFVEMADDVRPADVVTLDRVICCYPNLDGLAWKAAERARERLGVVHPRDAWWMRFGMTVMNVVSRPFGAPRFFVHRTERLEAILRSAGLEREWMGGTRLWRVAVYRRVAALGDQPATVAITARSARPSGSEPDAAIVSWNRRSSAIGAADGASVTPRAAR
jgi:magnesium-protoporphyrin O-methyltransferase